MVRFAVVGTNFITRWFLDAAALCPGVSLAAIYSRKLETARAFQQDYPAPLLFDDLDALAACQEVDAVYIATPNALHASQALRMLRAGKHVLVEKPAASNFHEVKAMADAAADAGVVFLEAVRNAFTPGFDALRQNLPKLGAIRRVTAVYCQYSSRYDRFKQGEILNAFCPALSNSALMDIGVYCVHPVVKLFGRPGRVKAASVLLHNGFEGAGTILADYGSMQADIIYSKITASHLPSEIQGEQGCMLIGRFNRMDDIKIVYRDGREEKLSIPACEKAMVYEIQAFADAIAERRDIAECTRASLDSAAVMDEARRQTGVRFPADDAAYKGEPL
ncbi:MAG: Gfo/Idh/MocA family oxidoreductase [Eubacteriales bacterium]|nr:Gfo/Idh/MocA family oxidoreductase [Eubacteriales bacterium]